MTETRTAASTVATDLAAALDAVALILDHANAETYGPKHAYQQVGMIYGDAHVLMMTLLRTAYGHDAEQVRETMLDSGVTHAEAAAHVAMQREDAERAERLTVAWYFLANRGLITESDDYEDAELLARLDRAGYGSVSTQDLGTLVDADRRVLAAS